MSKTVQVNTHDELDQEWVDLFVKAFEMGITTEEIQAFFEEVRKSGGPRSRMAESV